MVCVMKRVLAWVLWEDKKTTREKEREREYFFVAVFVQKKGGKRFLSYEKHFERKEFILFTS